MFMRGFCDELVKLAAESSEMPSLAEPPDGATFKGKPDPLPITPKKDVRLNLTAPPQPPSARPLVEPSKPAGPEGPGPAKIRPAVWDRWQGRGVALRVPFDVKKLMKKTP